jgi:hypothetical protein
LLELVQVDDRLEDAERLATTLINIDRGDAQAWYQKSRLLGWAGKWSDAREVRGRGISTCNDHPSNDPSWKVAFEQLTKSQSEADAFAFPELGSGIPLEIAGGNFDCLTNRDGLLAFASKGPVLPREECAVFVKDAGHMQQVTVA